MPTEFIFMALASICAYALVCALIAAWGERKGLGFWLSFGLAFVTTPLFGLAIVWRWDKR